ncbi:MAG: aspartyl/glutamyl-tRNA amidotransferase subunit A [Rickettsiales bacterium]|jgi:aspartyl-tRNA(Asn)/glutamyl-tRNA(Gln) amidotransferase subunit A|nr:aspartyl/glutamyl-tRNA amidotransferase subunit A [Rickettsiales bacterium]
MNLTDLTITEALQKLRAREISATELTQAHIDRTQKHGAELNCYITTTPERAMADAAESDRRYADGAARMLDGIPIGMKDNFATRGIRTTAASRILENFIPEYESTVSQKLADAGTVLLGKTNMSEFGMASTPSTSCFGPAINPRNRAQRLSPGGSSSGSAAAVAGGLCIAATGTDTGNSIRFPASLCGLVGIKPTYGLCSRFGCIAFASSLDHPGAITRTVDDAALMLSAMAGHDEKESTSAPKADEIARALSAPLAALPLAGIKIGLLREFGNMNMQDGVKSAFSGAIESLKSMGAEIVDVSVPHIMDVVTLYLVISRNEASSNLARYDGMRYGLRVPGVDLDDTYCKTRAAGFGPYIKYRMVTGSVMLTEAFYKDCFLQAAKIRRMLDNELKAAFAECDFILNPASPCVAVPVADDFSTEQFDLADTLQIGANMSGLPAVSVPMGLSDGLPIGMHIMGRRFDDLRVLQMAKHVETIAGQDNRPTAVMGE